MSSKNDSEQQGITADINELLSLRFYAQNIQFFNSQRVNTNQVGQHVSRARGRGMDFEEVRHYQPGDDIRLMHWPLTARLGKPYTKVYKEERERAIYFIIDQSSSMQFGTRICFKSVLAAKVCALLGWAALHHHEQVGGVVFSDEGLYQLTPARSRSHLLKFFKCFSDPAKMLRSSNGHSLAMTLKNLSKTLKSGSVVIVVSDFVHFDDEAEQYLKLINRKSEIIQVFTYDPLEVTLPDKGQYCFSDGQLHFLELNAADRQVHKRYAEPFAKRLDKIKALSNQHNMQFVALATNDDLVKTLNHGVMRYGY
ncbi:DUF58 domain-containing protein [Cysteiniphilum halobium]|uniref:DUF58 domain-containing protein n=1 Tax=Cysteiniphilum halobium TaxID=2219059 RepID=UPI003F8624E9